MYLRALFSGIVIGPAVLLLMVFAGMLHLTALSVVLNPLVGVILAALLLYYWVYASVKPAKRLKLTGITLLLMLLIGFLTMQIGAIFFPPPAISDQPQNFYIDVILPALALGIWVFVTSVASAQKLKLIK